MSGSSGSVVAVLGAGTMGIGIAQAFATAGFATRVWVRSESSIQRARVALERNLDDMARAGLLPDPADVRSLIAFTTDLREAVGAATAVIEAVKEDLALKQELFAELDALCDPGTLLGTNTSGLSVTAIASGARHPGRIVATHFWNPAHLIPLVEVGRGQATAEEMVNRAVDLLREIGKVPVVVRKEVPGFIGTRLQQALVREAIYLLEQEVATAEDIDTVVKTSFGLRFPVIGPLETTDLGGLDVVAAIHRYLLPDLCNSTTPSALLIKNVEAGRLGVKTGGGFYDWTPERIEAVTRARDLELAERVKKMRGSRGDGDR